MSRIAISTLIVKPSRSGSNESYLVNLVRGLAALGDDDFVLFVSAANEALFRGLGDRFRLVRLPLAGLRPLRMVYDQLLIPFLARREGATVVHFPGTIGSVLRPANVRQVVTIHYDIDDAHAESVSLARKLYYHLFMPRTRANAAALIVPSHDFGASFGARWNVPRPKLHVVHHGVTAGDDRNDEAQVLARFGIGAPGFLLSVTNALPHKNTIRLLEAYAQWAAMRNGSTPQLVLAGNIAPADLDGWRAEAAARGVSLPGGIVRTGFITTKELDVLYRNAALLALPTLIESSSMPVIEAMAHGCPVIASDIGVHREIGGDAAVLVDPRSTESFVAAFQRLTSEPAWRNELAERGRRRAAHYSWEECARKTAAVYAQAV